ncbi:MAG TPA: class I SAM-dependent methyltransferase [Leeuwenhoekiella sp.]|nr:class I SAM-dependent methyltransferase [Leeuwenhoekiella sp.]
MKSGNEQNRKQHWETVYETKNSEQVSWTQEKPKISLDFLDSFMLDKNAKIIDVGGGDSKLVDYLLEEGYSDITVLDISAKALEKAKSRLGDKSKQVKWIVSDITEFKPTETYDVWHDRATFHFLTTAQERDKYFQIAKKYVSDFLIIGTFSKDGPEKCSGLNIKQYSEQELLELFGIDFDKLTCLNDNHITPFSTPQNFVFCSFKKKRNQNIF